MELKFLHMTMILFVFIACMSLGYLFVPTSSRKMDYLILNYDKIKKSSGNENEMLLKLSAYLIPYIHIQEAKKRKIQKALDYQNKMISPEAFVAYNIIVMILIFLVFLPFIIVFPIAIFPAILLCYFSYHDSDTRTLKVIRNQAKIIENELASFSTAIEQELRGARNIPDMLESYMNSNNCGIEFKNQLDTTISDLKSGNEVVALTRLSNRVESTKLTEIVRCLIAVLNGDSSVEKFEHITQKLYAEELARRKKEAQTLPNKIVGYIMTLVFATIFYIVGLLVGIAIINPEAFGFLW